MLENKNDSARTPISTVGEFGLIDLLNKEIELKNPSTIMGIGDDAAVLDAKERSVLVSTDMLVEGVHFDLSYAPLKHVGYKAVVENISDICAMNGVAEQILVSVAISNRFTVEAMEELYEGMRLAGRIYGVDIVGGDTTSSMQGLIISITVIGYAEKGTEVRRGGAKEGDLLVVTGDLGAAYMGLQVLRREKEVWKVNPQSQPDLEPYQYILERQLKPEARADIRPLLAQLDVHPTSMIDISDGLSSEVLHICQMSDVGVQLYEEKIPKDPQMITTADEFSLDSSMVALSGGEDYELLFTMPIAEYDKIKGNPNFTPIGHITAKDTPRQLVLRDGSVVDLKARGWNSFDPDYSSDFGKKEE
ncbi:MAG: thiamine-phosphate kinase [Flavobacteriales bacterium]|nr:thiamine-phosphate kinase [Flavobacteriales bacterium]